VRQLFKSLAGERMTRLDTYGTPELGTVTGANEFFALSQVTRRSLTEARQAADPSWNPALERAAFHSIRLGGPEACRRARVVAASR
jgi:hypothetical protein